MQSLAEANISPSLKEKLIDSLTKAIEDEDQLVRFSAEIALEILMRSDISAALKAKVQKILEEAKK